MKIVQNNNISWEWMRGYAAGITAYEDYFLAELVTYGILNADHSGAAILDPSQSEKVRVSLLRIVRRINAERAAAAWGVRKTSDTQNHK